MTCPFISSWQYISQADLLDHACTGPRAVLPVTQQQIHTRVLADACSESETSMLGCTFAQPSQLQAVTDSLCRQMNGRQSCGGPTGP